VALQAWQALGTTQAQRGFPVSRNSVSAALRRLSSGDSGGVQSIENGRCRFEIRALGVLTLVGLEERKELIARTVGGGSGIRGGNGHRGDPGAVTVMTRARGRSEILHQCGDLAAPGRAAEIGRKRGQLLRLAGVALSLCRFSIGLEVCRDLLGHLRVLGRVGLLKLLQRADQLPQLRNPTAVRLPRDTRAGGAGCSVQRTGCRGIFDSGQSLFQSYRRDGVDCGCAHAACIGDSGAVFRWPFSLRLCFRFPFSFVSGTLKPEWRET